MGIFDLFEEKIEVDEVYSDGSHYIGEKKDGLRHGKGTFIWPSDGRRYVGKWKFGVIHGRGLLYYPDRSGRLTFPKYRIEGYACESCLSVEGCIVQIIDKQDGSSDDWPLPGIPYEDYILNHRIPGIDYNPNETNKDLRGFNEKLITYIKR